MKFKNIIDISWPITEHMTEYKNQKSIACTDLATFEQDKYRKSILRLSSHTGTHVDAPSHFLEQGKTIDQVSLGSLVGSCRVLDLTAVQEKITRQDLEKYDICADQIILLKTKNSFCQPTDLFNPNFIYIEEAAARYLADCKIKAIGIDYLGIERNQPGHETHDVLLRNDIGLIEGLRFAHVEPGNYFLCCLPIAVQGLDGAPARAILLEI
jgi:arylformamidase